ncbi:tyrosine-type recombinase/integrase [Zhenhengia yiwuensis]|uniref:tyrosine-type recombinase/integrase n=1 Tax=Zhenhengia yiwuensis TaxID=2763666 RepID=UPI002A75F413|nr:tyrosine-type recombinase/integrase [Zhenhengia yiwuensis]MDY3366483.1 tyrosine-type recombinase/integrase [Zhenhengia yiwuensis]
MAKKRTKANGEGTIYVEKRNNKNYYKGTITLGYSPEGKLIRKTFCSYDKKEVVNKMAECRTQNNAGLLPTDDKITLQQWFYNWLFEFRVNDLKVTSFCKYEGVYRNYIKDTTIGKKKLTDLRAMDLQSYYNQLITQGKSPNVIKTLNKHLKTSLFDALKQGMIARNPCCLVTLPRFSEADVEDTNTDDSHDEGNIIFFTKDEQTQLVAAVESHRNRALFLLALGGGLRLGELLGLKWNDISFNDGTVTVTRAISQANKIKKDGTRQWSTFEHAPKTKSSNRTIPLPSNVVDALKKHQVQQYKEKLKNGELYQDNNLVFCTELGSYIDIRNLTRSYARVLKRAGLEHKKFHSLRHTYATRLFENNIPPKKVQALMGHNDISTTMNIYTHVIPEKLVDDVQCLNALLI